jgi:serine protease Do
MTGTGRRRGYTGIALAVIAVVVIAGVVWNDYREERSRLRLQEAMARPSSDPLQRIPVLVQEALEKTLGISWELPRTGQQGGVAVGAVRPGSPAAKAGFRRGDGILSCQGQAVRGPMPLLQILKQQGEGGEVEFQVARENVLRKLVVRGIPRVELPEGIPEMPGGPGPQPPRFIPLGGLEMTVEFVTQKRPAKVVVSEVKPGGSAEASGLKRGDEIKACEGSPVERPLELISAIYKKKAGESVKLEVARGEQRLSFVVKVAGAPAKGGKAPGAGE